MSNKLFSLKIMVLMREFGKLIVTRKDLIVTIYIYIYI
jgi:hypothetical protein